MKVEGKITVKEIIEELARYNQDAEFRITVNGQPQSFEICYGGGEGCTIKSCDFVDISIDSDSEVSK